jgi:hypothetical protein
MAAYPAAARPEARHDGDGLASEVRLSLRRGGEEDEDNGKARRAFDHHARSCYGHFSQTYRRASRLCQMRVNSRVLCS